MPTLPSSLFALRELTASVLPCFGKSLGFKNEAEVRMRNARGRAPCIRGRAHGGRLTHSRRTLRCNPSDLLLPGCVVRYGGMETARFMTYIARLKVVNIHFPGRVKRLGFFTRFCVFVEECAKGQVGANKK